MQKLVEYSLSATAFDRRIATLLWGLAALAISIFADHDGLVQRMLKRQLVAALKTLIAVLAAPVQDAAAMAWVAWHHHNPPRSRRGESVDCGRIEIPSDVQISR